MSIAADTSVWIDYFRNPESRHARALNASIESVGVCVPDVVLLEVLRGIASEKSARTAQAEFEHFELVQVGGRSLAVAAARNYRLLREKGVTVRGTIDLMIGTWCIVNNTALLHNDRDFEMMERHLGLECVPVEKYQ